MDKWTMYDYVTYVRVSGVQKYWIYPNPTAAFPKMVITIE